MFLNEKVAVGHVWARYASHTVARPLIMALAEGQILLNPTDEDDLKKMEEMMAADKKAEAEDSANALTLAEHRMKYPVPWRWLPANIKNHGWCLVKCCFYDILHWAENMALEKKYVGVKECKEGEQIRCNVRQMKYRVNHHEPGEVTQSLDEWETDYFVSGTCLSACL